MKYNSLGLKLWSSNTDCYYFAAKELYAEHLFDYIELYVVPDTVHTIETWVALQIPIRLHAPHSKHKINLADIEKRAFNKKKFLEVREFQQALQPDYIVVHAGMNGSIEETARQIQFLQLQNILLENKPYIAPFSPDNICRGASFEEIEFILRECSLGFCLDIGHAFCAANSFTQDPYAYLKKLESLNPRAYHISGNFIHSDIDRHLHMHEGDYAYDAIFSIINIQNDIAIETNKDSKEHLLDFKKDALFLKKFLSKSYS